MDKATNISKDNSSIDGVAVGLDVNSLDNTDGSLDDKINGEFKSITNTVESVVVGRDVMPNRDTVSKECSRDRLYLSPCLHNL